jgi:hypothetical protein
MKRKHINSGRGNIRIRGGMVLPIILAKQTCRCAECLGPLADATNGLKCAADATHKGIIHRDEAAEIAQQRAEQLQQVKAAYTIQDGVLVALDDQIGVKDNAD